MPTLAWTPRTPSLPAARPKVLDRVRWHLRVKHYSIRTEQAYIDWIRRFTPWDNLAVGKHYVYVLHSSADRPFYVGLTNDLPARLAAHNSGLVPSTRKRVPLILVYWEGCLNRGDAARREKYLKSAWGKRYLKTRLRHYLTGWILFHRKRHPEEMNEEQIGQFLTYLAVDKHVAAST